MIVLVNKGSIQESLQKMKIYKKITSLTNRNIYLSNPFRDIPCSLKQTSSGCNKLSRLAFSTRTKTLQNALDLGKVLWNGRYLKKQLYQLFLINNYFFLGENIEDLSRILNILQKDFVCTQC